MYQDEGFTWDYLLETLLGLRRFSQVPQVSPEAIYWKPLWG
jgi:hypothetical protein